MIKLGYNDEMAPPNSPEAPKNNDIVDVKKSSTTDSLRTLKEKFTEQNVRDAIDSMIEIAEKNNGVLSEKELQDRMEKLTDSQKKLIVDFLTGKDASGKPGSGPVASILGAINTAVDRMGLGDRLKGLSEKFKWMPSLGDQGSFVKKMLIGFAAKTMEKFAFWVSPNKKAILDTAVGLRIAQLGLTNAKEIDEYTKAYKECGKVSSFAAFKPPADHDEAVAILNPPKAPTPVTVQIAEAKPALPPAKETAGGDSAGKIGAKAS